jgi:ATP-dependent helicase HrpA
VAIRCLDAQARALQVHHAGLRRLLMLRMGSVVRDLKKRIPNIQALRLQYAKVPQPAGQPGQGKAPALEEQILALGFDQAFLHAEDGMVIRDRQSFESCYEAGRGRLFAIHEQTVELVAGLLADYQAIRKQLSGLNNLNLIASVQDIQQQLDGLVYQGFLQEVPVEWLHQYPRYLKAIRLRMDKLRSGAQARDRQCMQQMSELSGRWQIRDRQAREKGVVDPRLQQVRWELEELRISLFAQEVKTIHPVSVKRIDKLWRELGL